MSEIDNEEDRPDIKTRFKVGNRFWALRSSAGRNPIFTDPDTLWDKCCEYFQSVEDNPLIEAKPFSFQGASWCEPVEKMQAMTVRGLCIFLDINQQTWKNYKADPVFLGCCEKVEDIIINQKFTGASAGLLNPMIIARDLGLRENTSVDHSSTDGTMTPTSITRTIVYPDGTKVES